jgi:uncharacterized Zn finger protein
MRSYGVAMTRPDDPAMQTSLPSEFDIADDINDLALIVRDTQICPSCGPVLQPDIEVLRVDAQPAGWLSLGRVSESAVGRCPRCGMVMRFIETTVPVELAEYACPFCESGEHMRYKVLRVERGAAGYEFVAEATCASCTHLSVAKRILRALGKIRKVKVGPSGVEVELDGA